MEPADIQALLQSHIEGCEAEVQVDGGHVHARVISERFDGLNTLKRQQLVYGALNEAIADGRIHAVHMQTFTPAEWQAQSA